MAFLGAHESVSGGLHRAYERVDSVGGEALQIFTRNQRQWRPKPLSEDEIIQFAKARESHETMQVASHGSYLINLASGKEELSHKSINALILEFERCHLLNIPYVVLHPGSHTGDGVEVGLDRVVAAMDQALEKSSEEVMLLLETTAGQGTGLGSGFEELAYLRDRCSFPERVGFCVDTCHIFAAGYDLRTAESYGNTIQQMDEQLGLDNVKFFHLNDSKKGLGSRVDRHEHIGKGEIGLAGFEQLVNDSRFSQLPMTLETPKGDDLAEDRENLATLRSLIR